MNHNLFDQDFENVRHIASLRLIGTSKIQPHP